MKIFILNFFCLYCLGIEKVDCGFDPKEMESLQLDNLMPTTKNEFSVTCIQKVSKYRTKLPLHNFNDANYIVQLISFISLVSFFRKREVFFYSFLAFAFIFKQSYATLDFEKLYGGTRDDVGFGIQPSADGGYYVVGNTGSQGTSTFNFWIFKVDASATKVWDYATSCSSNSWGYSIVTAADGGALAAGFRKSGCVAGNNYGIYLAKYTTSGTLSWGVDVASNGGRPYAIKTLADGNYIIVGEATIGTTGMSDGYACKVTSAGALVWYNHYGGTNSEIFNGVIELSDHSLIAVGSQDPYGTGIKVCYVVKMTSTGTASLTQTFGGSNDNYCTGVELLSTGNIAITGATKSIGNGDYDVWLLVIDSSGTKLLEKYYGGAAADIGSSIKQTSAGKIYIAGHTSSKGGGVANAWLINIDTTGASLWDNTFGGTGTTNINSLAVNSDGSLAIVGSSNTNSAGGADAYVLTQVFDCPTGKYYNSATFRCTLCSAGYYNPTAGATSSSACIVCPKGTYQDTAGSASCIKCPANTYNPSTTGTSLSACISCTNGWATNIAQDQCLYKGIFTTIADFTASPVSTLCFTQAGAIIKPLPISCRSAYRPYCCVGSTKVTTIQCNSGLEISSTDSLYDKYCSACLFANQLKCPTNGLCFDDTTFISNTVNPYPATYSTNCLAAVGQYCSPRLVINYQDPECYMFNNFCGATVASAAYYLSVSKFRITFTIRLSDNLPACTSWFNPSSTPNLISSAITCTQVSNTIMDVGISSLTLPITKFGFSPNTLLDYCQVYLSSDLVFVVTPPTPAPEFLTIGGSTPDKCMNLTLNSVILVIFI